MSKSYTEVQSLVRAEIASIKKRDGELGPTPYVVLEVASRLRTITPWDGYDPHKPLAANLRDVIEEMLKGSLNVNRPVKSLATSSPDIYDMDCGPYIETLQDYRDSKRIGRAVDLAPIQTKKAKLKQNMQAIC